MPKQKEIDRIANNLGKKFTFSKEITAFPEDLAIYTNVIMERLEDYEAKASIVTTLVWEERYVFVFGLRTLPCKLEEEFGTVKLLQGLPRDRWSWDG